MQENAKNGVVFLSDDVSIAIHQSFDNKKLFRKDYREKIFYDDNYVMGVSTNSFDKLATSLYNTPLELKHIIDIVKSQNDSLVIYDRKRKKFYTESEEENKRDVFILGSAAALLDESTVSEITSMSYRNVGYWFKCLLEVLSVSRPEIGYAPQIVAIDESGNVRDYRRSVKDVYEMLKFPDIVASQKFKKEANEREISSLPYYVVAIKYKNGVIFSTDSIGNMNREENYVRKIFSLPNGSLVPEIKFKSDNGKGEFEKIKRVLLYMLFQLKDIDETKLINYVNQLKENYVNVEPSIIFSVRKGNDIKLCHAAPNAVSNFDFFFSFRESDWLSKNSAEMFLVKKALDGDREAQRILDISLSDGSITLEDSLKILKWAFPMKYRPQFVIHSLDEGIKDYVKSNISYYQMIDKKIDKKYQKIFR